MKQLKLSTLIQLTGILVLVFVAFAGTDSAFAANYSITYNSGLVSNMPDDISDVSIAKDVTLPSTQPTRFGYKFNGWCTISSSATCEGGTIYAAGSTWTLSQTSPTNTLALYATWQRVYTMQEFAAGTANTTCPAMSVGDTLTLADSRDDNIYVVGKLADDNCWMLENLALDLTNVSVKTAMYNSTDTKTNASYAQLGYLFNGGGSSPNTNYGVSGIWTDYSQNYYDRPMIDTSNKDVLVTSYGTAAINGKGKVGVYYNYCAVSAGTYCYSSSSSSGNAQADICPKGWHLPAGGGADLPGSYYYLFSNDVYGYSSSIVDFRSALSTPLSGSFGGGSANLQDSYGYFWSSTRRDGAHMYDLYIGSSDVDLLRFDYRDSGRSVRCVVGT